MSSIAAHARPHALRRWGGLAVAAAAWIAAYLINEHLWTWLFGSVLGWNIASGWGSAAGRGRQPSGRPSTRARCSAPGARRTRTRRSWPWI